MLIDATIVRALLVPALMALFGRWNWWLPERVARAVRVEPLTAAGKSVRGGTRGAPPSAGDHPS